MLSLLLIHFIARYFASLAYVYKKNIFVFSIIGILSYLAGSFLGGYISSLFKPVKPISVMNAILEVAGGIKVTFIVYTIMYLILKNNNEVNKPTNANSTKDSN
jgi:hypothetical protein